jgi:cleavage stimulation factor subunit 3
LRVALIQCNSLQLCLRGTDRSQEVHTTFEKLLAVLSADLDELDKKIQSANSSFSSNAVDRSNPPINTPMAADTGVNSINSSFAPQSSEEKPTKSQPLVERWSHYGLVWIMYTLDGRRKVSKLHCRCFIKLIEIVDAVAGYEAEVRHRLRFGSCELTYYCNKKYFKYHCTPNMDVVNQILIKGMDNFSDMFYDT